MAQQATTRLAIWAKPLLVPVSVAAGVGSIGIFSIWVQLPWLFASVGPTIVGQSQSPDRPSSRTYNVVVSHIMALAVGFLSIYVTGAAGAPPFDGSHDLLFSRVAAAVMTIGLGVLLEVLLRAEHPSSAATGMLVSLGIVPATWRTAASMIAGIVLVGILGEAIRRMSLALRD